MKVREIMDPAPASVLPEAQVAEVAQMVLDGRSHGVPVVNQEGDLVGLVTELDLVQKHARLHMPKYLGILGGVIPFGERHTDEDMRRILAVTAAELMTTDVPTISPDAEVDDAATLMVDREISPILVVEEGTIVGAVTHASVIGLLILEESDAG